MMYDLNEWMAEDQSCIAHTYGRNAKMIVSGSGVACVDEEGHHMIDFTSGIGVNSLGFADGEWVQAVSGQLASMQHISNLFYSLPQIRLAQKLTGRTGMKKVFFANSGAEANECAIKTARKHGPGKRIITLVNSFHGRTLGALTATGQEKLQQGFGPLPAGFDYCHAGNIEQLKTLVDGSDPMKSAGKILPDEVESTEMIHSAGVKNTEDKKTIGERKTDVCAIMLELIQGEGGVIPVSKDFAQACQEICREKDILLIIDEVQTGIGRTGTLFAYEQYGLEPDMVTFAKGIGSGLPLGGVLFGEKTAEVLQPGDHGTTFGGNPAACAGACVVLDRLSEDFLEGIAAKGKLLKEELEKIPQITDVTGMGLMLGCRVKGMDSKEVVRKAMAEGLLLLTAKDKIRMLPPLVITEEQIKEGVAILKKVMG